jgi:hypothetical protein
MTNGPGPGRVHTTATMGERVNASLRAAPRRSPRTMSRRPRAFPHWGDVASSRRATGARIAVEPLNKVGFQEL